MDIAKKTTTYAKRISTTAADVEISVEIAYAESSNLGHANDLECWGPREQVLKPAEDKIDGIADPAEPKLDSGRMRNR